MNIALILSRKFEGSEWALDGDDYAGLTWLSESSKPTKAALEKLWPTVQHELELERVKEARREAYRLESDPLFFEWQRGEATEQAWKAKVAEIQKRHPEPTQPE
jgi:hypothetical protein